MKYLAAELTKYQIQYFVYRNKHQDIKRNLAPSRKQSVYHYKLYFTSHQSVGDITREMLLRQLADQDQLGCLIAKT